MCRDMENPPSSATGRRGDIGSRAYGGGGGCAKKNRRRAGEKDPRGEEESKGAGPFGRTQGKRPRQLQRWEEAGGVKPPLHGGWRHDRGEERPATLPSSGQAGGGPYVDGGRLI